MDEALRRYVDWLEEYARLLLEDYTQSLEARLVRRGKEFNDPVWGTILLQPLEVAALDSPILQRLRTIRQLGVVHLVYPSATHTRLEHVVGAVHQVERLVQSINAHDVDAEGDVIDAPHRRLLRLTALCHDIGHGAMSHVSENAIMQFGVARKLRAAFLDETPRVVKASLSEIAAYYFVGSPAFRAMVAELVRLYPKHVLPDATVESIQLAIVGSPIHNRIPLLNQLISGPFDADKLDYMHRDAYMCGVPDVTDVPRLIQKVQSVELSLDELPLEVAAQVEVGPPSFHLTGLALSGARTLDELILGRILLFDKLYRHQKVRSAEAMISVVTRVLTKVGADPCTLPYAITDEVVFNLRTPILERLTGATTDDDGVADAFAVVEFISAQLRHRDLWVRAFAFAQHMPLDPYRADPAHAQGLTRLITTMRDPDERQALADRIAAGVEDVLTLLGTNDIPTTIRGSISTFLHVDPPRGPPEPNDQTYLITPDRKVMKFTDEYAETAGWAKAYHVTRDVGYVFAARELAPFVYVASEKLLREEYGIRPPATALTYSRQDSAAIDSVKNELLARKYYDAASYDLRPLPERMTKGDFLRSVDEVVKRLEGYKGPVRQAETVGKATLNHRDRLITWLHQFGNDADVDAALRTLGLIRRVGRETVTESVSAFLGSHDQFRGGCFVPLGEAKDSSAVITYYLRDVSDEFGMRVHGLEEALRLPYPIVFADDFIGSGSQAISVIEGLLGVEPTVDLHEERRGPLPGDLADSFRSRPLAFVFAAGSTTGADAFRRRLDELSLNATVNLGHADDMPKFQDPSAALPKAFVDRCADIGRQLLVDDKHEEPWREERCLGYGNDGYLVVFDYNTPAQTLTCLWADGVVDGVPWMAAFPRRKKP